MPPTVQTDWVSPAKEITGRDHLAVQAVSEHLYTGLLPGLTNVTYRADCYAFYPWFVWAFDQLSKKKNPEDLIRTFRRAECLHTLIGIVHGLDAGDEWEHGTELVGRDTLLAVAERILGGEDALLSKYATEEPDDKDRYFKNRLGGLGQYYLGSLRDLRILDGSVKEGVKYTLEWGAELARLYAARVDTEAFFKTVVGDRVNAKQLRALSSFCPCHLRRNKPERDGLISLLFNQGEGDLRMEGDEERRQTLTLLLDHARAVKGDKIHHPDPNEFLTACYTGFLPNSTIWSIVGTLAGIRKGWEIYKRHELLAISVQGLFWAGLSALLDEGGYIENTSSYAKWFANRFHHVLNGSVLTPFTKQLEAQHTLLPKISELQSPNHEINLGEALLAAQKSTDVDEVVRLSTRILFSLLARGIDEAAYGSLVRADRFFETYEINLFSLQQCANNAWKMLNGREWLQWLATSWALRVHFRVALRKLRYQSQDSFRIVPRDEGYRVREAPAAQWSSPRLNQALRFLYDLGALNLREDLVEQPYELSPFGEQLLESELARH